MDSLQPATKKESKISILSSLLGDRDKNRGIDLSTTSFAAWRA